MNGVRRLVGGTPEIGESREAPSGANLRQEETGEGDGFRSVLSRIAGLVRDSAISSEAGEKAAARYEESPSAQKPGDEPFPGAPGNGAGPLHAAERQIRILPVRVGERLESLHGGTSAGGDDPPPLAHFPSLRDSGEIAVPAGGSDEDSLLFDAPPLAPPPSNLPSAFQALGQGLGQTLPATRETSTVAVGPIPVVHSLATIVGSHVDDVETGPAATPPPASLRRSSDAGIGVEGATANLHAGEQPLVAAPLVTVISRERHLAPAQRAEPAKLGPLSPDPEVHTPVHTGTEPSAAPDRMAIRRNERPAGPADAPAARRESEAGRQDWADKKPVARRAGMPPAPALAPTESAAAPATAPPGLNQNVLQKIAGSVIEAARDALVAATPIETTGPVDRSTGPSPVRVLNVRVDLQGHGAVHVRLALSGDALSLRVRADSEEIVDELRQEQARLSDALSAAGYDPEIVAIDARKAETPLFSRNDPTNAAGGSTSPADHGAAEGERRPAARQPPTVENGFAQHSPLHDRETHETRNSSSRGAGDLYV